MVYTANWVIIYHRSHLLREPETAIDMMHSYRRGWGTSVQGRIPINLPQKGGNSVTIH